MSDIKERIQKIYPEATFEEADTLLVNVAEKDWHLSLIHISEPTRPY